MKKLVLLLMTITLISCGNSASDTSTKKSKKERQEELDLYEFLDSEPDNRYVRTNEDGTVDNIHMTQKIQESYLLGEIPKTIQDYVRTTVKGEGVYLPDYISFKLIASNIVSTVYINGNVHSEILTTDLHLITLSQPSRTDDNVRILIHTLEVDNIDELNKVLTDYLPKLKMHDENYNLNIEESSKWMNGYNSLITSTEVLKIKSHEDFEKLDKTKFKKLDVLEDSNGVFNFSHLHSINSYLDRLHKLPGWTDNSRRYIENLNIFYYNI